MKTRIECIPCIVRHGLDVVRLAIKNPADQEAAMRQILDMLSSRAAFASADLIIAKGQGNYETLNDAPDPRVFFLLKVKCAVVAADLGVEHGAVVVKQNIA